MPDITELKDALRDAIEADTDVSDLLGASNKKVLESDPAGALTAPFVTWRWARTRPKTTRPGRDDWQIDIMIYAATRSACSAIGEALVNNWTIPHEHLASVDSTNYALTELHLTSQNEAPGTVRGLPGLADMRLLVQTWRAKTRTITDT
jgi:hypothetical protein